MFPFPDLSTKLADPILGADLTPQKDLGVYVHVPFCKHECPYCDFTKFSIKGHPASLRANFPGFVGREISAFPETPALPLQTIYLGGGTPSLLVPESLAQLLAALRGRFGEATEVTLEANPENITAARLKDWAALGINRLSIGIQSFEQQDLLRLERLHSVETLEKALALVAEGPIANWSGDLMFALPGQSVEGFLRNLERLVEFAPQHVSFYGLTIHEGTPFFEEHRGGKLVQPGEEAEEAMYRRGHELLEAKGFTHYEVSNYAKPGSRSAHNQRYWQQAPVLGFGPGAWSQWGALRWMAEDDYTSWTSCLEKGETTRRRLERCTPRELLKEQLFAALRQKEGFVVSTNTMLAAVLEQWLNTPTGLQVLENEWVVAGDCVRLTLEGWLRWDALVQRLDQVIDEFKFAG